MTESTLLHELVARSAARTPEAPALTHGAHTLNYAELQGRVAAFAAGLRALGIAHGPGALAAAAAVVAGR